MGPCLQASDQWAINHAIDDHVVDWEPGSRQKMKGIDSFQSKFFDNSSHVGFTRTHRSKYISTELFRIARRTLLPSWLTASFTRAQIRGTAAQICCSLLPHSQIWGTRTSEVRSWGGATAHATRAERSMASASRFTATMHFVVQTNKWKIWQHLLKTAYALHCFPPHSMPCPGLKHGEKGCDKSVIMGSKVSWSCLNRVALI